MNHLAFVKARASARMTFAPRRHLRRRTGNRWHFGAYPRLVYVFRPFACLMSMLKTKCCCRSKDQVCSDVVDLEWRPTLICKTIKRRVSFTDGYSADDRRVFKGTKTTQQHQHISRFRPRSSFGSLAISSFRFAFFRPSHTELTPFRERGATKQANRDAWATIPTAPKSAFPFVSVARSIAFASL